MNLFIYLHKSLLIFVFYILHAHLVFPQKTDSARSRMYNVNVKWKLPAATACVFLSSWGFQQLDKVASMDAAAVQKLDPNKLNFFDRPVAFIDPAGFDNAQKKSDLFLNVCLFTPAILALDKNIRKDWLDLITLYLASHAVDNAVYFAFNYSIRRPRPLVYNPLVPLSEKTGEAKSNSFFSGHTSFSATATFFVAKVYTDYHHIKGWKKALIYTAAAVPPALVGYYRMRAGKHFKTDVMMGLLSGAASGIFVPELHKFKKKHDNISFAPYYTPGASGLTVMIGL